MTAQSTHHRAYSFGAFTLDITRGALFCAGVEIQLRPRSFAVLCYLVERAGRLVAKNELLNAIWGHTSVTDGALTQCLVEIRRAIRDETQTAIRTVPRRGYLFDLAVTEHAQTRPEDQPPHDQACADPEQDRPRAAPTAAAATAHAADAGAAPADGRAGRHFWMRWAAAWLTAGAAVLLALAAVTAALAPRSMPPGRVIRAVIPTDAPAELAPVWGSLALTPDGTRLAYIGWIGSEPGRQLLVAPLDTLDAKPILTVSEGSNLQSPFASPDGKWLGYVDTSYTLRRISITGGSPRTVATLDGPQRGATWAADDSIVFATAAEDTGLQRVHADAGSVTVLTRPDRERGERNHWWPDILPDGRGVLFTVVATSRDVNDARIDVLDFASQQTRTLVHGGYHGRYVASGHLVYAEGDTLRAVAFDPERLEVTGTAETVESPLLVSAGGHYASFSVSADGALVYVQPLAEGADAKTLVWVDRSGEETPLAAPAGNYRDPRVSPLDDTRLAFGIGIDLWAWEGSRAPVPLTFTPVLDWMPLWTSDGERLVFGSWRDAGVSNLYTQAADGMGPVERLSDSPYMQLPSALTPDGSAVLFTQSSEHGRDLYLLLLDPGETVPLLVTPRDVRNAVLSPNGRWMAYESDSASAPGRLDVYVRRFPVTEDGGEWRVSTGGGTHPLFSTAGDELFYLAADGAMMAVPVQTSGGRWIQDAPVRLFHGSYFIREPTLGRHYDVTSDSQRFLMIKEPPIGPFRIVLVHNFAEELRGRLPR